MKISPITFDKSVKTDILKLYGKTVDEEGFIIENDGKKERVLTPKGEEIRLKEWGGIYNGSEAFVKSDTISLIELAKKIK